MKETVFALQGYNSDGLYSNAWRQYYEKAGYKFVPYMYGQICKTPVIKHFINTVANRWRYKTVADCMINLIQVEKCNNPDRPIHIVAHSNGALIAYIAATVTRQVESVTLFNAALDTDTIFPCPVTNFYCTTDWTVRGLARLRPFHDWGGYGSQPNKGATNIKMDGIGVKGHSDFLDHLDELMPVALRNMP